MLITFITIFWIILSVCLIKMTCIPFSILHCSNLISLLPIMPSDLHLYIAVSSKSIDSSVKKWCSFISHIYPSINHPCSSHRFLHLGCQVERTRSIGLLPLGEWLGWESVCVFSTAFWYCLAQTVCVCEGKCWSYSHHFHMLQSCSCICLYMPECVTAWPRCLILHGWIGLLDYSLNISEDRAR